jgi:hypothetical protein
MAFFAEFRMHEGHQSRFDTRIYLREFDEPGPSDICVAAIIGKNPGSANPMRFNQLARLSLDGDKLLPYVRNRFVAGYALAGTPIPQGAFVRVWNLLYICDPKLSRAIKSFGTIQQPLICETERVIPRIVWFAWGPPNSKLRGFMSRFIERGIDNSFYFDITQQKVVSGKPLPTSKVKHTQGLPADPIEKYLARFVG